MRYVFAGDMLNFTEVEQQNIAGGTKTPEEGMQAIQSQLMSLIESLNLPMG